MSCLWRSRVHGQPQRRPAAQIVLTSLGYQLFTMRSADGNLQAELAARKTLGIHSLSLSLHVSGGFWWFLVAAGVGAAPGSLVARGKKLGSPSPRRRRRGVPRYECDGVIRQGYLCAKRPP